MASSPELTLLLSSEHGSARVPARYAHLFRESAAVLASHRGLDIGSAELAAHLARRTGAALHRAVVTRLLIDCNRSPGHPGLYSEFSRRLPAPEKQRLIDRYYRPYRAAVAESVTDSMGRATPEGATVLHVSVHSYTRTLDGVERDADVGLLYDPARGREKRLCLDWQALLAADPSFRVRRNYPYRGVADGLVTAFRRRFPAADYVGVELEVCQDIAVADGRRWQALKRLLGDTLAALVR